MMRRLAICIAFSLLTGVASAQSFRDYLSMRQRNGVVGPSDSLALDRVVGSKAIEISAVVKGFVRLDDRISLMVERQDRRSLTVDTVAASDWLLGNEVPARLLLRVIRPDRQAPFRLVLIGAAPEADMRRLELDRERKLAAIAAAEKAKKEQDAKKRAADEAASSKSPLFGPIGKPTKARSDRRWQLPVSEVTPIYASFMKRVNPRLATRKALEIAEAVVGLSLHYRVDARLVMAVLMVESGFKPNVISHSGAMGLGQLMPDTARGLGVQNPFDTTDNLYGSVKLLRQNLDKYRNATGNDFRSLVLCLAAYNAGPGAVRRHGGVPPYRETQRYVRKVMDLYFRLAGA